MLFGDFPEKMLFDNLLSNSYRPFLYPIVTHRFACDAGKIYQNIRDFQSVVITSVGFINGSLGSWCFFFFFFFLIFPFNWIFQWYDNMQKNKTNKMINSLSNEQRTK